MQDHRVFTWPRCAPPQTEYEGEEYQHLAKDHDMVFDLRPFSNGYECTAPGYGELPGHYGNGSILTRSMECVEIIDHA